MMPEDIPCDHRLGPHVNRYEVRTEYLVIGFTICAATVLMGIAAPIFGHMVGDRTLVQYALWSTLGLILFMLCGYCMSYLLPHVGLHVDVHQDGIVIVHRGKHTECGWHEIKSVWYKVGERFASPIRQLDEDLRENRALTIQRIDAVRLKLTGYLLDFESLAKHVLENSKPYLLSAALKSYRNGETVDFDRMSVSQHGIMNGKKLLSWDDFGSIKIESGRVFVRRRHGRLAWFGIPAHKVANAHVLVDFVSEVCPE
jgi:uncharacterized protein DUF6585